MLSEQLFKFQLIENLINSIEKQKEMKALSELLKLLDIDKTYFLNFPTSEELTVLIKQNKMKNDQSVLSIYVAALRDQPKKTGFQELFIKKEFLALYPTIKFHPFSNDKIYGTEYHLNMVEDSIDYVIAIFLQTIKNDL